MKANINVVFMNLAEGEEPETGSFSCEGELYKRGNKVFISYKEPEAHGGGKVVLTAGGGKVTMDRRAEAVSSFTFEEGKTNLSRYFTPYGTFLASVAAKKVSVSGSGDSGEIKLEYSLKFSPENGEKPSLETLFNTVEISYSEVAVTEILK